MQTFELQAKARIPHGTRKARGVRRNEMFPAVVYGHGMKPLAIEVPDRGISQGDPHQSRCKRPDHTPDRRGAAKGIDVSR